MRRLKPARNRRGVTAIEFALVLPVLLAILLGIVNYGLLVYNQAVITNAAREGARWAAIHNTASNGALCSTAPIPAPPAPASDACSVAYSYARSNLFSFSAPALTVTQSNSATYTAGAPQTVTVEYTFTGIATYFVGAPDGKYKSSAVMLHE